MNGSPLRPEAEVAVVDVREHRMAPWPRLAEGRAGWQRHVDELRRDRQALDRPREPPAGRLTGDDPNLRSPIQHWLRQAIRLQVAILRPRHLFASGQVEPELQTGDSLGTDLRHFFVHDAAPRCHPLNVTRADRPTMPQRVFVPYFSFPDDRDRLDPAVRVIWEARLVVPRVDRLEVVEEQEGVEVVELSSPDAAPEVNSRTFDDRFRRDLLGSSSLGCESHRLDAPVGVRNTLDHTIPLQEVEAPRQGRLVDGKRVLELPQIRGAHAGDRRENAELSYPQTARPQDVVVQLCHGPAHHAECIADACGQPSRVVSAHRSGASSIHDLMLSATSLTGKPLACRYILPYACGSIDFRNPASDGRRLKGQAEPRDMTDRRYDPNVTRSVQDPDVVAPQATVPRFDSRTRLLLEGPIVGTLLRLATPNVLVMFVQAAVGLIETYFVAKLGTDALAGVALVFPVLMLMQMMSAGAVGGGIMSAIARALGAGRRADADALVLHALAIAVSFGLVFMLAVLGGGRWLYGALGGRGASLAAAQIGRAHV